MATENSPQSIADWYHSCIAIFEKVASGVDNLNLQLADDPGGHSLGAQALAAPQLVRDQLGRFRVWVGNMGAHHRGGRMSLDYKLEEASHIRSAVTELLEELNGDTDGEYVSREPEWLDRKDAWNC